MQTKIVRKLRTSRGASAIELAVGSLLFVCLTLLSADIAILVVANGVNNEACRDAARAAGMAEQQQGQTAAQSALQAAKYALTAHQRVDGVFIQKLQVVDSLFVYNNGLTSSGQTNNQVDTSNPNLQPTVFVATQIKVKLPAQINWFDKAVFKGNKGDGTLTFQSAYLYPIMNIQTPPSGPFDLNAGYFYSLPNVLTPPLPACTPTPLVNCGGGGGTGGTTGGTGGPGGPGGLGGGGYPG